MTSNVPGEILAAFNSLRIQLCEQFGREKLQSTRADWIGPSENSCLCSKHFTKDCFEKDTELAAGFGIKKSRRSHFNDF